MPDQKAKRDGLTPKQRKFVAAYRAEGNATKAAIAAGYSEKTAYSAGARLLRNVGIASALNKKLAQDVEKFDIRGDEVLRTLKELAFFDPAAFYGEDGQLKSIHEIPLAARRALGGLETEELFDGHGEERARVGDTVKVKWSDRIRALELLGKHLKLFTDRVEHSGKLTLEQLLSEAGE
jgi:phage terminase small subunit